MMKTAQPNLGGFSFYPVQSTVEQKAHTANISLTRGTKTDLLQTNSNTRLKTQTGSESKQIDEVRQHKLEPHQLIDRDISTSIFN